MHFCTLARTQREQLSLTFTLIIKNLNQVQCKQIVIYLVSAYLQRGGYNIILLNAPRLEAGPWYYTAARNTEIVGKLVKC